MQADLMLHYGGGPQGWSDMEFDRVIRFHDLLRERLPKADDQ
jgi:hypothetical protein